MNKKYKEKIIQIKLQMKLAFADYLSFNRFTGPSSVVVSGHSDHQIIQSSGSEFFKSGKYKGRRRGSGGKKGKKKQYSLN